ncbi:MAG: sigma-54-dependent Fis family transcriptional regulator [Calditrichaeota bacterium]|nr:sigma-54-dependent Fis family transcriptional regulator [Calditrichota bacterium]
MDIAMEVISAERGFILLLTNAKKWEYQIAVARNISRQNIDSIAQISTSVVQHVLKQEKPILTYDATEDERFQNSQSIVFHHIRSIACVPLKLKNKLIGTIYVDSLQTKGKFNQETLEFLTAFANQAAIAIDNTQFLYSLQEENYRLRNEIANKYQFDEIVGNSTQMRQLFDVMKSVLNVDASVLIEGESGTGKELVARAIHYNGHRKNGPFVPVFCGALSESLLESELFGHKKGSFTGAREDKKGLFEIANGGTLFLDEITEVSLDIQTKLLRVLQEREIKRVGENSTRAIDVRIIAATNKNIATEVKEGRFRQDLYYRLNVILIKIPPLRQRQSDILLLANHFVKKYSRAMGIRPKHFSKEAVQVLKNYSWPGNVRELENTIERALILGKDPVITVQDIQLPQQEEDIFTPNLSLKEFENRLILKTLDETGGNITKAAESLDVSRRWLHYRLKEIKKDV